MTVRRKYILLLECFAKRLYSKEKERSGKYVNMEIELAAGSLLEESNEQICDRLVDINDDPNLICLRSLDYRDVYLSCLRSEVDELTTFEADVLYSVKPYSERMRLYMDDTRLEEAEKLKVNDAVLVEIENCSHHGVLRYKGPVPERSIEGIWFGVELKGYKTERGCDGSIGAKRYFSCAPKSGLFVSVCSLRCVQSSVDRHDVPTFTHFNNKLTHQGTTGCISSKSKSSSKVPKAYEQNVDEPKDRKSDPPLSIDDRVVWISDEGPEYGIVRWIGKLPDAGDDWMVGVEFDNPVGMGTGSYNDLPLFQTAVNHAAIVPIMGLMKANDFSEVSGDAISLAVTVAGDRTQKREKNSVRNHENIPSSMFIPHEDHPLSHYQETSGDNHGSHNSVGMSRESLPYLPHQVTSHSHSRDFDSGIQCMNNYATSSPNGTSSSLPAYDAVIPDNAKRAAGTNRFPTYTSKLPLGQLHNNIRTSSESTLASQSRPVNFRMPGEHSTLPSYSSQTIYPASGASECSPYCMLNHRHPSEDPSSGTLTSAAGLTMNSSSPHSRMDVRQSALVSSCPEMDSGSFYHVMPDDCKNSARNSVINLKANDERTSIDTLTNNCEMYDDMEDTNDDRFDDPLEVGSVVEVIMKGEPKYGLIKWIGTIPEYQNGQAVIAGIELEEESSGCTDGTFNGYRLFDCPAKKGFFVQLNKCRKDRRFTESDSIIERPGSAEFGSVDCPVVMGDVAPLSQPEDIQTICGKYRGIQGHHNSCYLDATLFSMFSFSPVFDCILHRPSTKDDIDQYSEVQQVLKEEIVNPLRRNLYVRADRVMKLRKLLERLSSVSGLTCEEKDPEEFLNSLLNQIMKAEPFLKLSSGQESFFYQLFVEKDDKVILPTVQQLFDQSFLASDIKLKEIPSCLLIQMPRFGKQFKMYPRIIPSPYLDITDILEDSPRQCCICGQVAEFECKQCYRQFGEGLESTAFCAKCLDKSHSHQKRSKHNSSRLQIPNNFQVLKDHTSIPRIFMELFAVVCIETSHYVAFVKCGTGPDAPWCFFDSMADRRGEQNGYNIPEVVSFKDLKWWLSEEGFNYLLSTKDDKNLPEMPKRLLCDAYMCLYQSPDVMMYR